jgi:hypothetical protein
MKSPYDALRCFLELPPLESSLTDEDDCGGGARREEEGGGLIPSHSSADTPCTVYSVTIAELGPEDLYRLAWAYTAAWINGKQGLQGLTSAYVKIIILP